MSRIPGGEARGARSTPRILEPNLPCPTRKPLVSVCVPAYNEAAVVGLSVSAICAYLESLEDRYRWELVVVDDGSTDNTGDLARAAANGRENVRVLVHPVNLGMGSGLRNAFAATRGDYVITLDLDLSYSVDHIGALLDRIAGTGAQVVVASPYAPGGRVSNVPWMRLQLSRWANRFLAATAKDAPLTLTGIVRAYDGPFLRSLSLRSKGMEINPEIIYKSLVMRARIEEMPAHLDWGTFQASGRGSSMRVLRHMASVLMSGYLIKPFMFFMLPGFVFLLGSFASVAYLLIRYPVLTPPGNIYAPRGILGWFSSALGVAYENGPQVFLMAVAMFLVGVQMVGFGFLALQGKRNFDELYFLGTTLQQSLRKDDERNP